MVNRATIVQSEVFVYNLGTMFYIDAILYSDILSESIKSTDLLSKSYGGKNNYKYSTLPDVESVPNEFTEKGGGGGGGGGGLPPIDDDDEDLHDDEIVTPRALPLQYSPKK